MNIRTLTVALEAEDTSLASLAESFDDAIGAACEKLEAAGHCVIGIVPVAMRVSQTHYGDSYRDTTSSENGILAVITYQAAIEAEAGSRD